MRQSNIELLRLLAMVMVLGLHTFFAPEVITFETLTPHFVIDWFKESACISAVNLFVLISGYFGIRWKLKGFLSVVFQLMFFYILCMAISVAVGHEHMGIISMARQMGWGWLSGWWFASVYIGLYIMAPVLNAFVEKVTKRQLFYLLVAFYVYQTVLPSWFNSGYSIISFMGLYLIGRLLSTIDWSAYKWFKSSKMLAVSGGVTVLFAAEVLLYAILRHHGGTAIQGSIFGMSYNNPLVILQSITFFVFFLTLRFTNKTVNWFASSALSIYLLHLYPGWKQEFYALGKSLYQYDLFTHYALQLGLIMTIMLVAVLIDKVRIKCFEWGYPWLERFIKTIIQRNRFILLKR